MEARFKAGDIVKVKCQPNARFFVIESIKQTCYAGVEQVFYDGRLFWSIKPGYQGIEGDGQGIALKYSRFSEIELEPAPEPETNPELEKLHKQFAEAEARKDECIKSLNFEQAAVEREEQRRIKNLIEIFPDEIETTSRYYYPDRLFPRKS